MAISISGPSLGFLKADRCCHESVYFLEFTFIGIVLRNRGQNRRDGGLEATLLSGDAV